MKYSVGKGYLSCNSLARAQGSVRCSPQTADPQSRVIDAPMSKRVSIFMPMSALALGFSMPHLPGAALSHLLQHSYHSLKSFTDSAADDSSALAPSMETW